MKYLKEINFNKIKDILIKRKYIVITVLVLLILSIILIYTISTNKYNNTVIETNYEDIKELIDNKEIFIIYYYNSKSSNKFNKTIKKELNKKDINYYIYDDNKVDKEEYNQFLKLLDIDKSLFGTPAIIYIKEGVMYSNLININNKDSFNKYIEDYDLITIK